MKVKELAEKLGTTPMQVGRIRARVCGTDDYNAKTKNITPSGVGKIMMEFDRINQRKGEKERKEEMHAKLVRFRVTQKCPNPVWVLGVVDGEPGKRKCRIPQRFSEVINEGSVFKAEEIESYGNKFFRHYKCKP